MTTIDLGMFPHEDKAWDLHRRLQGQTYMDLQVCSAPCPGGRHVTVSTDRPDTSELDLAVMVARCLV